MDLMKSAKKQMRKKAWETLKKRRNTKKRIEKLNIKNKISRFLLQTSFEKGSEKGKSGNKRIDSS